MTATFSEGTAPPRIAVIDLARGIAVYFMALYHLAWDLNDFQFTDFALFSDPFWLGARTAILASFLFLAGLSMVLAAGRGRGWSAFWRRWTAIVLGAGLVSLGTYFIFPQAYVFFGVLHCIAVASLLVLPFLTLSFWYALAAGIAVWTLPHLVGNRIFDHDWLQWIGFVTRMPESVDYVPIFPWAGVMLLGIAYGNWRAERPTGPVSEWQPVKGIGAMTAWVGRHTLVIYILHQPLLVGLVWLAAQIVR
ncbi:MAG TPA: hypothetical protein DCS82_07885 [Rhodospirillaceae bacterium]|nr:hypothetical protein [Rhodospirillaceae bacterium]MBL24609.1 hypothetical protein [Rhodospirillaceae bacterium]HAA91037.1 hypothetical protein [Rhodospirillaceae bacterium]HAT35620.1 hypothetical protein [Rhodospirillaceae bacterium]